MTIQRQSRIVMTHDMIDSTKFAQLCQCYACLQAEPELKMNIDEQMIPYKGKNSLRQYLSKKPIKKKRDSKSWYVAELEVSLMTSTYMTVKVPHVVSESFSLVTL